MKTDELIDLLVLDLKPVRLARLDAGPLVAAALAVSGALLLIGARADLLDTLHFSAPWLKAGYPLLVCCSALWLATLLGRPGSTPWRAIPPLVILIGGALISGIVDLLLKEPGLRINAWLGSTWAKCSADILMLSAISVPFVAISARKLAPTQTSAAGLALGLAAGAMAATAYGLLRCPETSIAFVASWYTFAMAGSASVGFVLGPRLLRW